ncbi:MAG: GNAT family N-acetyltransferase [Anaerolineaceae bacterium]|nr:GNAT family N-acetyltransferase [Anaerolineaceae bacterium]
MTTFSSAICIVEASWRDLGELRNLEAVCFGEDAWPLFDLIGVLTLPRIVRLKAVNGDRKMVAFIAGDPNPDEKTGWITTIAVLPAYRKQSIGSRLLKMCEERMGLPFVRLCVRHDNKPALAMYARAGYRHVRVWRAYYHDGADALVLEKIREA